MPSTSKTTKKKPTRTNFGYTEEALANAPRDIREKNIGIRETCRYYGIPRSTVQDRLSGKVSEKPRKVGPDPIFSFEGEAKIVNWIIKLAKSGLPVNKEDLLNTVVDLAKDLEKDKCFPGGKPEIRWYQSFLRRHPEISVRDPETINKAREAVKESGIRKWFADLEVFLAEKGISDILKDPKRILNGDETGISLCPKTGKVLAPEGYKNVYKVNKGNEKETITVLIVMTAAGEICPPLVVFPYLKPARAVVQSVPDDWVVGKTESGWMRSDVFYEYIANDFTKWLLEKKVQKPVLLFVDGHKSHMSMPLSEFCEANDIILYALPPNTTHILQPADVSVFKPLKQHWKETVIRWQSKPENINKVVTKTKFCKVFKETLNEEMVDTIKNGFRKCGLYPFDVENVDFTKCVKDAQIRNSTANAAAPKSLTERHFNIAKAVFLLMKDNIAKLGIDPRIIMSELERTKESYLKERRSKSRTPRNSKTPRHSHDSTLAKENTITAVLNEENSIQIQHPLDSSLASRNPPTLAEESSIDIPEIGSLVSLSDISVIPFDEIDILDILSQNKISASNKNAHMHEDEDASTKQAECTVNSNILTDEAEMRHEKSKNLNTPLRDISAILNNPDTSPEENQVSTTVVTATVHESPKNSKTGINNSKNKTAKQQNTIDGRRSFITNADNIEMLEECDVVIDPFQKHLKFPTIPPVIRKKGNVQIPSAISGKAWRDYHEMKDKIKQENEDLKKKRKLEREAKKKEPSAKKSKMNQKAETKNKAKQNQEKQKCSDCQEDLISDTEEDAEKNIGCDSCIRWYHLRCTTLKNLKYVEAAVAEYKCEICKRVQKLRENILEAFDDKFIDWLEALQQLAKI